MLGWPTDPVARRVVNIDSTYYIMARRWKCKACKKTFSAYDDEIMEQLPQNLQLSFPGKRLLYNANSSLS